LLLQAPAIQAGQLQFPAVSGRIGGHGRRFSGGFGGALTTSERITGLAFFMPPAARGPDARTYTRRRTRETHPKLITARGEPLCATAG